MILGKTIDVSPAALQKIAFEATVNDSESPTEKVAWQ